MMDNIKIKTIGEKNNEEVIKTKNILKIIFWKKCQNIKRKKIYYNKNWILEVYLILLNI